LAGRRLAARRASRHRWVAIRYSHVRSEARPGARAFAEVAGLARAETSA